MIFLLSIKKYINKKNENIIPKVLVLIYLKELHHLIVQIKLFEL